MKAVVKVWKMINEDILGNNKKDYLKRKLDIRKPSTPETGQAFYYF